MDVALLKDEPGRDGGPPGGARNDRGKLGAASDGALVEIDGAGLVNIADEPPPPTGIGGGGIGGTAWLWPSGGIGLAVLVGGAVPFGGGGVALAAVLLPGSFLLTHFFKSLS